MPTSGVAPSLWSRGNGVARQPGKVLNCGGWRSGCIGRKPCTSRGSRGCRHAGSWFVRRWKSRAVSSITDSSSLTDARIAQLALGSVRRPHDPADSLLPLHGEDLMTGLQAGVGIQAEGAKQGRAS